MCVRNKQKDKSTIFIETTERSGLLFAGDKIVIPDKLKRLVVHALHFRHPGSTKKRGKQYNPMVRDEKKTSKTSAANALQAWVLVGV